jgi:hypothetical protein
MGLYITLALLLSPQSWRQGAIHGNAQMQIQSLRAVKILTYPVTILLAQPNTYIDIKWVYISLQPPCCPPNHGDRVQFMAMLRSSTKLESSENPNLSRDKTVGPTQHIY